MGCAGNSTHFNGGVSTSHPITAQRVCECTINLDCFRITAWGWNSFDNIVRSDAANVRFYPSVRGPALSCSNATSRCQAGSYAVWLRGSRGFYSEGLWVGYGKGRLQIFEIYFGSCQELSILYLITECIRLKLPSNFSSVLFLPRVALETSGGQPPFSPHHGLAHAACPCV